MKLAVITATTNPARAAKCLRSWRLPPDMPLVIVLNTATEPADGVPEVLKDLNAAYVISRRYLGTVPAFQAGVDYVLAHHPDVDILACFHDDVLIEQPNWTEVVIRNFERRPQCGLAGFGGAIGLGASTIYQEPYNPMQLARIGFRSDLHDAEVHGIRSILAERVACLDGFSQIGRREFFAGHHVTPGDCDERPLTYLVDHGIVHHGYDGMLGCLAARYGWEVWYLPVRCTHYGGQTAVLDQGYQAWAKSVIPGGDAGFWEQSHRRWYELFKDVLPLRV